MPAQAPTCPCNYACRPLEDGEEATVVDRVCLECDPNAPFLACATTREEALRQLHAHMLYAHPGAPPPTELH